MCSRISFLSWSIELKRHTPRPLFMSAGLKSQRFCPSNIVSAMDRGFFLRFFAPRAWCCFKSRFIWASTSALASRSAASLYCSLYFSTKPKRLLNLSYSYWQTGELKSSTKVMGMVLKMSWPLRFSYSFAMLSISWSFVVIKAWFSKWLTSCLWPCLPRFSNLI